MLLLITNKLDVSSDVVISMMRERKLPFFRWNVEDFLVGHSIKIDIRKGVLRQLYLKAEGRWVDLLKDISVVWYRRALSPKPSRTIAEEEHRVFARREGSVLLNNIWILLRHKVWLNTPIQNQILANKLYQLQLAAEIGLETPPTLVTNEPSEALGFYRKHKTIVAKPLSAGYLENVRTGRRKLIYTRRIQDEDMLLLQTLEYSPVLFQKYIEKKLELRITAVGDTVFSCAIESQKSEKTRDDWRRYDLDNVPHYPYLLPEEIEDKLLQFMQLSGINFGAFDLILTPDNHYIFLEVNPNGQWYWIERLTGLPITRQLVNFFAKHIREEGGEIHAGCSVSSALCRTRQTPKSQRSI